MKDLSKITVEKIKEEQIKPKARWKFLAKNFSIWVFLVLFAILGAISLSLFYYLFSQTDWDVINLTNRSMVRLLFVLIPYFWLILLGVFSACVYLLFRHTKKGYRFTRMILFLSITFLFLVAGFTFHYLRADQNIDRIFSQNLPGYQSLSNNKEREWSQPNLGLLGGTVIQTQNKNFELQDFQGNDWEVSYDEKTILKPSVQIASAEKIKVIGDRKGPTGFEAKEIRPWEGKGMMRGREGEGRGSVNKD